MIDIYIYIYSCGQNFTYTLQYLQNVSYFTKSKIREIKQNACYFLFSSDLNKIFHINNILHKSTTETNSWIYKNYTIQKLHSIDS